MGAFLQSTTKYVDAIGIGMQAFGQFQAGSAAEEAADYNARLYEQQAGVIGEQKRLTAEQYDRLIKRTEGETVVAVAASGFDLTGSSLEVLNDTMTQQFLDKEIELYNLEVKRRQSRSAAAMERYRGEVVASEARTKGFSTLLTQGNEWYQKYGGFGKADPRGTAGGWAAYQRNQRGY